MTSTVRCHSLIPAPPGRGTRDAAERRRPAIRRRSKAREAPALAGRGRPARTLSPERNALAGSAHAASERASRLPRSRRSRRRAPPQAPRSRARSRCQMASSRSSAPAYSPVLSRPPLPRPDQPSTTLATNRGAGRVLLSVVNHHDEGRKVGPILLCSHLLRPRVLPLRLRTTLSIVVWGTWCVVCGMWCAVCGVLYVLCGERSHGRRTTVREKKVGT